MPTYTIKKNTPFHQKMRKTKQSNYIRIFFFFKFISLRFGFLYTKFIIIFIIRWVLGSNLTPHLIFYPRFLCNKNIHYFNEIRQIGQQNIIYFI